MRYLFIKLLVLFREVYFCFRLAKYGDRKEVIIKRFLKYEARQLDRLELLLGGWKNA